MANLSDAIVNVSAEKVGKELFAYIKETQKHIHNYQIICDEFDDDVVVGGDLDLMDCNASGRWAYQNNAEGYFDPERVKDWLGVDSSFGSEESKKHAESQYVAYQKLCDAIIRKKGSVTIDYTDTDPAMEWMGDGVVTLQEADGELVFNSSFTETDYTVENFAAMQGEDEMWALGYMYGEEVAEAYDKYLEEWKKDHSGPEFEGMEPASADEWYNNEYQEEV